MLVFRPMFSYQVSGDVHFFIHQPQKDARERSSLSGTDLFIEYEMLGRRYLATTYHNKLPTQAREVSVKY